MKFSVVFVLFLLFTYTYSDICRKLICIECIVKSDCVYGENLDGYKCEHRGKKINCFYTLTSCMLNSFLLYWWWFHGSFALLYH